MQIPSDVEELTRMSTSSIVLSSCFNLLTHDYFDIIILTNSTTVRRIRRRPIIIVNSRLLVAGEVYRSLKN